MANRIQIQETLEKAEQLLVKSQQASSDFSNIKLEIESYRDDLLVDSESQKSVKTKVTELQSNLSNLYTQSEEKIKEIGENLQKVSDLHNKLVIGDTDENGEEIKSIEKQIEETKESIEAIYDDVSNKKEGITLFYNHIYGEKDDDGERSGGFKGYLENLKVDIDNKRKDVDGLLRDTTVTRLGEGYVASKYEYSVPKKEKLAEWSIKSTCHNLYVVFYNVLGRRTGLIINQFDIHRAFGFYRVSIY